MSFKCQSCGIAQEPRVKPHKVITEVRHIKYAPVRVKGEQDKFRVPEGYETVKELNVCSVCFETKNFGYRVVDSKVVRERMII